MVMIKRKKLSNVLYTKNFGNLDNFEQDEWIRSQEVTFRIALNARETLKQSTCRRQVQINTLMYNVVTAWPHKSQVEC